MLEIIEAADYRDRCVPSELNHVLVPVCPVHDSIHVSAQDLGGVRDRLAAAQLCIRGSKVDRVAPELGHPHLEADPRSGGGLLENHREALPLERLERLAPPEAVLEGPRQLEEAHQIPLDIEGGDEGPPPGHGPP